jgi:hypothetical protein
MKPSNGTKLTCEKQKTCEGYLGDKCLLSTYPTVESCEGLKILPSCIFISNQPLNCQGQKLKEKVQTSLDIS